MSETAHYVITLPWEPTTRPSVWAITVASLQREVEEALERAGFTVDDASHVAVTFPGDAS